MQPELEARKRIDALLDKSGWIVQDRQDANPRAGTGVAVREFLFDSGEADYGSFVDGKAIGAVEAKKAGTTLSSVAFQTAKYLTSCPNSFLSDTRAPAKRLFSPIFAIRMPVPGELSRSTGPRLFGSWCCSRTRSASVFAVSQRFPLLACGSASAGPSMTWRIPSLRIGRAR